MLNGAWTTFPLAALKRLAFLCINLLKKFLVWCDALHVQSDIEPEIAANKTFLQGHDKKGRPLVICIVKRHSSSKRVLEKTKRFIAYTLDNCIHAMDLSKNPSGKVVAIFDLRGTAMLVDSQYDPHMRCECSTC